MNVTSILLQEAVADLTKALSYETTRYLKTSGEKIEQSKLHHAENWKPIFNNVAQRYVEDLVKRNLDPKKRINVDLTALNKTVPSKDKYQNLLKDRSEIQDYLRKQIVLITDEGAKRVLKNRDPVGYANKEQEIKSTTPTPELTRAELKAKEEEIGLDKPSKKPLTNKKTPTAISPKTPTAISPKTPTAISPKTGIGSSRAFGGQEFEDKVIKALILKIGKAFSEQTKIHIPFAKSTDGASIVDRFYSVSRKNSAGKPIFKMSLTDFETIAHEAISNIGNLSKYDARSVDKNGTERLYEIKKGNVRVPTIFCELWKISSSEELKKMIALFGSVENAIKLYNEFIRLISTDEAFKKSLLNKIRSSVFTNNIFLIGLDGPVVNSSSIGIFSPNQLEFTLAINRGVGKALGIGGFDRLTVFVNIKQGNKGKTYTSKAGSDLGLYGALPSAPKPQVKKTRPSVVTEGIIMTLGELKEYMFSRIVVKDLLKENVRIQHRV